jgi:hypothetical protein
MKRIDQVLSAAVLAIVLGAGLVAANWPSVSGSTSPGVVIEDGAGNKLGVAGAPVIVQQITDALDTSYKVSTSQLDITSSTTFVTVPNLSLPLAAGKTYYCRGYFPVTSGATGGLKMALVGSNGLGATSYRMGVIAWNGTILVNQGSSNTFGGTLLNTSAVYSDVSIEGALVVSTGGTINVQAAQNVSNATPTSVFLNSSFYCKRTT